MKPRPLPHPNRHIGIGLFIGLLFIIGGLHLLLISQSHDNSAQSLNKIEKDSLLSFRETNNGPNTGGYNTGYSNINYGAATTRDNQTTICLFYRGNGIPAMVSTKDYAALLSVLADSSVRQIKFCDGVLDEPKQYLRKITTGAAVEFAGVSFREEVDFSNFLVGRPLRFTNCKMSSLNIVKLTAAGNNLLLFKNVHCEKLMIDSPSLKCLAISFEGFPTIASGNNKDDFETEVLYKSLIKYFDSKNDQEDLKKANIAFSDRFDTNYLFSLFSDYGYRKSKIIWISLYSLLLFFFIFLFLDYRYLHLEVYSVPNLHKKVNFKERRLNDLYFSFVYVAVIFFSVNISFENIQFKRRALFIIFILMYLWGLICLGFMVNFILAK